MNDMVGAPVGNRTPISGSGGLRHIRWTTGAHKTRTAKVIIGDGGPKSKENVWPYLSNMKIFSLACIRAFR